MSSKSHGPVILVLHAGGNDLCSLRVAELLALMRVDLDRFLLFFSEVVIVWSEIIPRLVWHGAHDFMAVERARRTVNSRISRFVHVRSGVAIRHSLLEGDNGGLMSPDRVHLNDVGIFSTGLQEGIEQALALLGGGLPPLVVFQGGPSWQCM